MHIDNEGSKHLQAPESNDSSIHSVKTIQGMHVLKRHMYIAKRLSKKLFRKLASFASCREVPFLNFLKQSSIGAK